jgi:hypothetical protein
MYGFGVIPFFFGLGNDSNTPPTPTQGPTVKSQALRRRQEIAGPA